MKSWVSLIFIPSTSHLWPLFTFPPALLFQPFVLMSVCWQLYKELSQCYQALMSSEANLRQSHQKLSSLLAQRDQHILQLQAQIQQQQQEQTQLQQLQEQIQLQQQQQQQQAQHIPINPSSTRQTNFKVSSIPLILHRLPHRGHVFLEFIKCTELQDKKWVSLMSALLQKLLNLYT